MVYTFHKQRRERVLRKCANMRAAKNRKRMEFGSTMHDVGGIATDGILGAHSIRFLSYGDAEPRYAVTVDGEHRQARTLRGIIRQMARMVFAKVACATGTEGKR